jgi:hypothetical protein
MGVPLDGGKKSDATTVAKEWIEGVFPRQIPSTIGGA